jgi:hypothetical protein
VKEHAAPPISAFFRAQVCAGSPALLAGFFRFPFFVWGLRLLPLADRLVRFGRGFQHPPKHVIPLLILPGGVNHTENKEFRKLMGIVEVNETYIGGKYKNRHWDKKQSGTLGDKSIVIGAVSRKGNVVARVIENTDTRTLDGFVRQVVSEKVSLIATDKHSGYRNLKDTFEHGVVQHSSGRYVDGVVHTQTIDGFWSLLKRGIMGSFHKVIRKYLPLYVAEFEFRYNNRDNPMIFETAIAGC